MAFLNRDELADLWNAARILDDRFENADDEEKVNIFLERLNKRPLRKAYAYETAKVTLIDVIEAEIGTKPSGPIRRRVALWASRKARESAKETLQFPKVIKTHLEKYKKHFSKPNMSTIAS